MEFDSDIIYVDGANLTVGGNGKLIGTAGGYALYADGDLTINGGTIEVTSYFQSIISFSGNVIINGGDIIAESDGRSAIYANRDVTINGGNVTATSNDQAAIFYGYYGNFTVAKGMKIQASTTVDGELGEYVAENHDSYKKIVITENSGTLGDVDNDGDVDAADYVLVKRAVLKTYTLSEKQAKVADVDADGDVDATDYVLVKRIVLGTYKVK